MRRLHWFYLLLPRSLPKAEQWEWLSKTNFQWNFLASSDSRCFPDYNKLKFNLEKWWQFANSFKQTFFNNDWHHFSGLNSSLFWSGEYRESDYAKEFNPKSFSSELLYFIGCDEAMKQQTVPFRGPVLSFTTRSGLVSRSGGCAIHFRRRGISQLVSALTCGSLYPSLGAGKSQCGRFSIRAKWIEFFFSILMSVEGIIFSFP